MMKRILLIFVCVLLTGVLLCGCAEETGNPSDSTGPQTEAATEEPAVTLPPLPPEEIAASLSAETTTLLISPLCRQVTLSGQDLASVRKAFTERGYLPVPYVPAEGTKLETVVLKNDEKIVTLIKTAGDTVHVLWEDADAVSVAPLAHPENPQTGDVTMVQIGIARESEKDNPMIGMCYLYRLGDGSALIIDGGSGNDTCAEDIMKALKKADIAKTGDGKYRISAWIFSHGHGDHIGAFKKFTANYAGQYEVGAVMCSFPSAEIGLSGCDAEAFEQTVKDTCPGALRIVPHAGLRYHFGNVTVHVLYSPDLLYTGKSGIQYFNNTSLILKLEANKQTVLHMGDAGEQASEEAWKENDPSAFSSDMLQITHHGLYTGSESHRWENVKNIYDAAFASYGLLPMGTRYPGDSRNGRYTVLIDWGAKNGYQVSYVLDRKDNHGYSSLSQSDFDKFVAGAEKGTAEFDTLFGFDGINIAENPDGMVTYLSAADTVPMATEFVLGAAGITVRANTALSEWLAG
ncbi:MAG: MBL fold metallo-hydrolase [Lachnospiraceae bacterium]|nr:MBL fold metallo-hydrolase [Lachnospiraceae bacterium]